MIGPLNHVAIAVPDLDKARLFYQETLGANVSNPHPLPEHGVTVSFVTLPNTKIELLVPLGNTSPIKRFLEKNPLGGLHHLCYEVGSLEKSVEILRAQGLSPLDSPKIGSHGKWVIFLHPKDTFGTLIELEQAS